MKPLMTQERERRESSDTPSFPQERFGEALRAGKDRFSDAFDCAPIGMGLVSVDGQPLRVNRALCRMFGYSQEEFLAMPVWQVTHPDDMAVTIDWLRRMLEGEVDSWQLEKRYIHRQGHIVWGLSATSLVRASDGRPLYLISQVQDITDYKRAQEEVTRLAAFPEDNPNPVIEVDGRGVPTYLNPAAREHFPDVPHGGLPPAIVAGLNALVVASTDRTRTVVVREIACAGRIYEEHMVVGLDRARIYLRDMTERVNAEAEVRQSRERLQLLSRRLIELQESERQHLVRELHDEIGQLLTGLRLALDQAAQLPAESTRRCLADAEALVSDLVVRVRDLSLDLRPPMLDDLGLLPALVWLCEWYGSRAAVRVQLGHRGIERRFTPELETAAFRIVQEALTNASRHAGVCEVTVQAWADDARLGVQVVDAGAGFDPAAVLNGATSGLAGMRERASLLGGQLTIESAVGSGTRVMAEFPLAGSV